MRSLSFDTMLGRDVGKEGGMKVKGLTGDGREGDERSNKKREDNGKLGNGNNRVGGEKSQWLTEKMRSGKEITVALRRRGNLDGNGRKEERKEEKEKWINNWKVKVS